MSAAFEDGGEGSSSGGEDGVTAVESAAAVVIVGAVMVESRVPWRMVPFAEVRYESLGMCGGAG